MKYDSMVNFPTDDELGLFENYNKILEETRRRIIEYNGKYILDIGCGTCNLCGELSSTYSVIGMDKNIEMLKRAKEKYKHINCRVGNFLEIPFKENFADIVVSTFAFHGLNNEEKKIAIKNMMKYLKETGKIIIVDYMFYNSKEKKKYKEHFVSCNREDLWKFINSKYYTNIEKLIEYATGQEYNVTIEHMVNFTWIVEIQNNII